MCRNFYYKCLILYAVEKTCIIGMASIKLLANSEANHTISNNPETGTLVLTVIIISPQIKLI